MKTFVKENTRGERSGTFDFGWGNGYVVIPKGHKLHGMHYNDIHDLIHIRVNGGITLSEPVDVLSNWEEIPKDSGDGWVVGFDTCHSWNTLEQWSKEDVMAEAVKLMEQLKQG